MTNGWGDDIDDELQNKKKLRVGFTWNFISTNNMITRFDQEVGEVDENYPKSELSKMWYSTLIIMCIFVLIAHSVLAVIALPFLFLYGMILFKLSKLFKRFNYSSVKYWIITVVALAVSVGANYMIWYSNVLPNLMP